MVGAETCCKFIPDDHICFFIANLVEGLDFKKNEEKNKYTKCKPAYSHHMLIRLVIMASVDGVFSSRKIMKSLPMKYDLYLSFRMDKPDFRTITDLKLNVMNRFKKLLKSPLKSQTKQTHHHQI